MESNYRNGHERRCGSCKYRTSEHVCMFFKFTRLNDDEACQLHHYEDLDERKEKQSC